MEVENMKKRFCIGVCLLLVTAALISVTGTVNAAAPDVPGIPEGPTEKRINEPCEFSIRGVNDSDGHDVLYLFDWGDTTDSGWIGPFPPAPDPEIAPIIEAEHKWSEFGNYEIKVKTKDNTTGEESAFSEAANINIGAGMPNGPTEGAINESYDFYVIGVNTTAGHDLFYLFDFGDGFDTGWLGPYAPVIPPDFEPPVEVEVSHTWKKAGFYEVKVKVKDNTTGVESNFSEPLIIDIGHRFDIGIMTGGFGVSVAIENTLAPSKYVDYKIEIAGGSLSGLHVNKVFNGTIFIESRTTATITTPTFFALGRVKITVTAECAGEPPVTKTFDAFTIFFYTLIL